MGCGCSGAPRRTFTDDDNGEACHPEPFRCQCHHACWLDLDVDYGTCTAACAPCAFPGGNPHHGFAIALPSSGAPCVVPAYDECLADCAEVAEAALAACTGDEGELCDCAGAVEKAARLCQADCRIVQGLPAWLDCLSADLAADGECCATPHSDCYLTAAEDFLTAAEPVELAYQQGLRECVSVASSACSFSMGGYLPPQLGTEECFREVERDWQEAMAPLLSAVRIARAECDRAEMQRAAAEDRKRPECGGRLRVCMETAVAAWDVAWSTIHRNWLTCQNACDPDDDWWDPCPLACRVSYRSAYVAAFIDGLNAMMLCLQAEYGYAPNGHTLARAALDCYITYIAALVACCSGVDTCLSDCAAGGLCLEDCGGLHTACQAAAEAAYATCLAELETLHRGDCPRIDEIAIAAMRRAHHLGDDETYYGGGDGDFRTGPGVCLS